MKLTGKCKEDFEKWYEDLPHKFSSDIKGILSTAKTFDLLIPSMQYGVYVDFFDNLRVMIEISYLDIADFGFTIDLIDDVRFDGICTWDFKNRQEARTKAIEKANELYNLKQ